jgi:hypothetical protein
MTDRVTQIKFTIESDIVAAFNVFAILKLVHNKEKNARKMVHPK